MPNFYITIGSAGYFTGEGTVKTFTHEDLDAVHDLVMAGIGDDLADGYIDDGDQTMNFHLHTYDNDDNDVIVSEDINGVLVANDYGVVCTVMDKEDL